MPGLIDGTRHAMTAVRSHGEVSCVDNGRVHAAALVRRAPRGHWPLVRFAIERLQSPFISGIGGRRPAGTAAGSPIARRRISDGALLKWSRMNAARSGAATTAS
jgi:hypothetical protein